MDKPVFFSVVIPTYNREKFIGNTLDTVLAQTHPHYEIVVVDNCSTDGTERVVAQYVESGKIKFIKHEQNYERACSRNTGMDNASGDYLTLLDSDDFMHPDCLADAEAFAKQNPQLPCFHNLYDLVDSDRKTVYQYKFPSLKNRHAAIVAGNFMSCIGTFLHREIYRKYRFDTTQDLTGGEDWEFWLRVLADNEVGRIEKVNSSILHHEGRSVNNQNLETMERGLAYLVSKFRRDEHLSGVYGDYLDRIEANCFLYLNLLANDGKMRKSALAYLKRSARADLRIMLTERFVRSLRRTVMG